MDGFSEHKTDILGIKDNKKRTKHGLYCFRLFSLDYFVCLLEIFDWPFEAIESHESKVLKKRL